MRSSLLQHRWHAWQTRPRPNEHRSYQPWVKGVPRSILLIRFQAIGDSLALLPVADALRQRFGAIQLGAVIGNRARAVVESTALFDQSFVVDLSGGRRQRAWATAQQGWALRGQWDVVLDLQRNHESRLLRQIISPTAWGEFDRFSPHSFIDRSRIPVREAGLGELSFRFKSHIRPDLQADQRQRLEKLGWKGEPLLFLNPSGAWPSRHWPLTRWIQLAQSWPTAKVLLLGEPALSERVAPLLTALGPQVINLIGQTTLTEALTLVSLLSATVSEDGGLLHASWLSGVPTVAILGSSRTDWHQPLGPHSHTFGSEDLDCGGCMKPHCARGDNLCLNRISVDDAFKALMQRYMERSSLV